MSTTQNNILVKSQLPTSGPRPANPTAFFTELFANLPAFTSFTFQDNPPETLEEIAALLKQARRIFFTGSGSSLAAASIGTLLLQMRSTYPAAFISTSVLLDSTALGKDDVVVLISHGLNRPDAILVGKAVEHAGATLVCVTGHPETETAKTARGILPIHPAYERLFCRPVSPLTGYCAVAALCSSLTGLKFEEKRVLEQIEDGMQRKSFAFDSDRSYAIVTSGLSMAAGIQMTLGVREGAGIQCALYETESYGHGWYVPDQRDANYAPAYVLIRHANDVQSQRAIARIEPLLKQTKSRYTIFDTTEDAVHGNLAVLAWWSKSIGEYLTTTGYDFNNPRGMAENMSFHDLASSWNTYEI